MHHSDFESPLNGSDENLNDMKIKAMTKMNSDAAHETIEMQRARLELKPKV